MTDRAFFLNANGKFGRVQGVIGLSRRAPCDKDTPCVLWLPAHAPCARSSEQGACTRPRQAAPRGRHAARAAPCAVLMRGSDNLLHALAARECSAAPPCASVHAARRFYEVRALKDGCRLAALTAAARALSATAHRAQPHRAGAGQPGLLRRQVHRRWEAPAVLQARRRAAPRHCSAPRDCSAQLAPHPFCLAAAACRTCWCTATTAWRPARAATRWRRARCPRTRASS